MEYSIAHHHDMNKWGKELWPDSLVPWDEAVPPDLSGGDTKRTKGKPRCCAYCGSLHPTDVVAAIKAGARGSWADMKYGWPHKAYFYDVPNPHAGLLESVSSANYKYGEDWVQVGDNHWRDPGTPAPATIMWKFYSVHLLDATPEERTAIETHLGMTFHFGRDGRMESWQRWTF